MPRKERYFWAKHRRGLTLSYFLGFFIEVLSLGEPDGNKYRANRHGNKECGPRSKEDLNSLES